MARSSMVSKYSNGIIIGLNGCYLIKMCNCKKNIRLLLFAANCHLLALFSAQVTIAQNYHWDNVLIGGGGYVVGVKVHPKNADLIYVRTDVGGLYLWSKAKGRLVQLFNWAPDSKSNLYGIAGIALHPLDERIIYVASGKYLGNRPHGVFKSVDYGADWINLHFPVEAAFDVNNENADHRFGNPIEVNPKRPEELWVGTVKDGLWLYDEKTKKWRQIAAIPTGCSIRNIVFDDNPKSDFVYIGIRDKGVYRSGDGGKTFALIPGSISFTIQDMDLSKDGDKLFLATETEGILRLNNARVGHVWSNISPGGYKEFRGLATSPNDNNLLVTSPKPGNALNTIFVSTTSGDRWRVIKKGRITQIFPWHSASFPGAAISQFAFDPDPGHAARVYFTDWYSVWKTEDVLETKVDWSNEIGKGHEEVVCLALASPPRNSSNVVLFTGLADVSGFRHSNVHELPKKSFQASIIPTSAGFNDIAGIDFSERNPNYVAISGENKHADSTGAFALSTDNGKTFVASEGYNPAWGFARLSIGTSDADFEHLAIVAASKKGGVLYSNDGGKTWQPSKGTPTSMDLGVGAGVFNHVFPLASDRVLTNTFYLYNHSNGKVLRSVDGGQTFTTITTWVSDFDAKMASTLNFEDAQSAGKNNRNAACIESAPGVANHLWGALGKYGLYFWNGMKSCKIAVVKEAVLMSLGIPASNTNYPSIYIYGKLLTDTENWIYRSADKGKSWIKINDASHRIGDSPQLMKADRQVYGRIFIGTEGTGVWFGEQKVRRPE